jgi:mono/diheme cytochrome c family protein
MRTSSLALCLMSVLAAMPARAQNATTDAAKPNPQIAHGYALLVADGCSECHGTLGQGSRASGPRIAPQTLSFEAFLQLLRHPVSDMPPYAEKVLSDADARDIHAYLVSIAAPTMKVGDLPGLNH